MSDKIHVNQSDALNSAQSFDNVTSDYSLVLSNIDDMESAVFGSWQGDAANAAKETFEMLETGLATVSDKVLKHAGIIRNAVGEYVSTDSSLAAATASRIG